MKENKEKLLNMHSVTNDEFKTKSKGKQWLFLGIQLVLSLLGAFALYNTSGYSAYDMVMKQETMVVIFVIVQVLLAIVFLFVGSTAYARGIMNTIWKWVGIIIPAILIVVINYVMLEYYKMPIGSGIVALLSIGAFYIMFSTSSSSLKPMGMIGLVMGLAILVIVVNNKYFESSLSSDTLLTLFQFGIASIFFFGLNFAKILYALTGTMNTNRGGLPGGDNNPSGNPDNNEGEA